MIAAYYYIKYTTIELFSLSMEKTTTMRGLIEIISNASEFEELTIRKGEEKTLRKLASHLPLKINKPDYNSTATKVNILLQCHFSRRVLPTDLIEDQNFVLTRVPRLLDAVVDVITSSWWLDPALAAMELSQLIVQAMWDNDPHLKQLPHVTKEMIENFEKEYPDNKCEDVLDILDLDENRRSKLLEGLSKKQINDIIRATNRYPNIELAYSLQDQTVEVGKEVNVLVQLERELEDDKLTPANAPHYPSEKLERWWLVVGDPNNNQLYTVKKVTVSKSVIRTKLTFDAPKEPGDYKLNLYFICDSYVGCDQEWELEFKVT